MYICVHCGCILDSFVSFGPYNKRSGGLSVNYCSIKNILGLIQGFDIYSAVVTKLY